MAAEMANHHARNRAFITLLKITELTVRQYFDGVWGRPYDGASDGALARFGRGARLFIFGQRALVL